MSAVDRRNFLVNTGKLFLGAAVLAPVAARAAEHGEHGEHGISAEGQAIDAAASNRCATCEFWGGMRKLAGDGKEVRTQSLGWCNNPKSPNHQRLTPPDHEMKIPGIWKKWGALV